MSLVDLPLTDSFQLSHHQIGPPYSKLRAVAFVFCLLHPNVHLTNFDLWRSVSGSFFTDVTKGWKRRSGPWSTWLSCIKSVLVSTRGMTSFRSIHLNHFCHENFQERCRRLWSTNLDNIGSYENVVTDIFTPFDFSPQHWIRLALLFWVSRQKTSERKGWRRFLPKPILQNLLTVKFTERFVEHFLEHLGGQFLSSGYRHGGAISERWLKNIFLAPSRWFSVKTYWYKARQMSPIERNP